MDKEQEKMDALFQLLDELLEYPIETSDDISDAELETYFKNLVEFTATNFVIGTLLFLTIWENGLPMFIPH